MPVKEITSAKDGTDSRVFSVGLEQGKTLWTYLCELPKLGDEHPVTRRKVRLITTASEYDGSYRVTVLYEEEQPVFVTEG